MLTASTILIAIYLLGIAVSFTNDAEAFLGQRLNIEGNDWEILGILVYRQLIWPYRLIRSIHV